MRSNSPTGPAAADIEALKSAHRALDTKRIEAKANLENAEKQLEALRIEARQSYGTDDLDALRQKLKEMREENERKRLEYQTHLEEIRQKLANVEREFSEAKVER